MRADSLKFQGHRCFKKGWSGFETIKPVNVIIGRNNTGKSHLLELVQTACAGEISKKNWHFQCKGVLDETSLKGVFNTRTQLHGLGGDPWENHGRFFVGNSITWELLNGSKVKSFSLQNETIINSPIGPASTEQRRHAINQVLSQTTHMLTGKSYRSLLADRDIRPEDSDATLLLRPDGQGATNIIRKFITTTNNKYPREVIQKELLDAMNDIFAADANFTELQANQHEDAEENHIKGKWEIYLGEEKKGLIPLSNSGSGLKTVLLVLLNLLVVPRIEGNPASQYTFAFEELENNLHPSLLRRLFQYIERHAVREKIAVFITTHSSTALDLFGRSEHAQIIRVSHDGETALAETVRAYFDQAGIISELGARPSDLLQANCVVWVEGPSDCIYFNRWVDIVSEGQLQEGRDYQCAFYAGALLARAQFVEPDAAENEFVNLLRVNPNVIILCDGDQNRRRAGYKPRVKRIRQEVRLIHNAHIWITKAREIENYIPGSVLKQALGLTKLRDPDQYESIFPRKAEGKNKSYLEERIKRKSIDKVELASICAPHMTLEAMRSRFDWAAEMTKIVDKIKQWNATS